MDTIGGVLRRDVRQGLITGVRAARIVEAATAALEKLWGAKIHAVVETRSFKEGVLTLACKNSIVGQEIMLREEAFLQLIQAKLGYTAIKRLAFTSTQNGALPEHP